MQTANARPRHARGRANQGKRRMKVLVIEDERKVVDYLRSGLTEQGWIVDVAMDGEEGAWMATEYDFDVIVLDVMLPKLDGFGVLRALRARKDTPVIMLTARDRVDDRVHGLRDGADDYLTKPFSFLELVERLRALTRRARAQESTLITVGDLQVDLISRRAMRDGVRLDLTAKEFQLLSVLARRRGEILSKTLITELVWDVNFESNANVVETAIKRLRAKLDGPYAAKLLHTIRGMGYVLEVREDGGPS
jgi:two-component system copper resistance phosphate regulon response regulator CusR